MKVNCFKCKNFRVTWDAQNPRGCTAYGLKCRQLPSIVVKNVSGLECMKFEMKQVGGTK